VETNPTLRIRPQPNPRPKPEAWADEKTHSARWSVAWLSFLAQFTVVAAAGAQVFAPLIYHTAGTFGLSSDFYADGLGLAVPVGFGLTDIIHPRMRPSYRGQTFLAREVGAPVLLPFMGAYELPAIGNAPRKRLDRGASWHWRPLPVHLGRGALYGL